MTQEINIVTAFFNIKRENWKGFSRTEDLYFEYFKGWAKLKNKIVVYVETEELKDKIIDFRSKIGLGERTIVNVINDCFSIAPDLYRSIKKAAKNDIHKKFRLYPNNPEVWNAEYDYIMLLKMWCSADAVERGQVDGMVAWMDFGYNHGGQVLDINSNFNYLWQYDFDDKINLFLIQDLDDRPIFDIVLSMDTYIMGMMIVGPAFLWKKFWNLMQDCMMELNACGLIDDDQNVILMAYRKNPQIFNTIRSGWQLPLKQFGGEHLSLNIKNRDNVLMSMLKSIYRYINKRRVCFLYAKNIYNYYKRITIH